MAKTGIPRDSQNLHIAILSFPDSSADDAEERKVQLRLQEGYAVAL